MKCPNCGYKRQKRDDAFVPATECPSCGIVYSKHEGITMPGLPITAGTQSAPAKKSALDPESLKKAKERVEKRLRDRLEAPVRDDHHVKTLKLARKLTAGAMQKRIVQEPTIRGQKGTAEGGASAAEPAPDAAEEKMEDPLLLEEAVGVSIFQGHNGSVPEESVEDAGASDPTSDDINAEASEVHTPETEQSLSTDTENSMNANSEPDPTPDDANVEASEVHIPETEQSLSADTENSMDENGEPEPAQVLTADSKDMDPPGTYPDDVQVETVVLSDDDEKNKDIPWTESKRFETTTPDEATATEAIDLPPAYMAATAASNTLGGINVGSGLKRMLPVIAWLILFAGVVGAVLSWTTISDVEAGVNIPAASGSGALPIGLLLGFAYLATGALGFAFFWVASLISQQLKDIRQLLMVHPISLAHEQAEADPSDSTKNKPAPKAS